MAGGRRVDDRHRDLALVPIGDVPAGLDLPDDEPLLDALKVVLEPVGHQDGLAVGGFDEVLQGIQLAVVQTEHPFVLPVHRAIGHLGELVRQSRRVPGVHLFTVQGEHQLRPHGVIGLPFLFGEVDLDLVDHAFRHIQIVAGPHGDGDVGDPLIDGVLSSRQGLIGEHHLSVSLVRLEVGAAVPGDEPAQASAHVQHPELRPQVHQPIGGGRAGQAHDALDAGPHLQQCAEPLGLVAFEGGQLIDDHHVIVER